MVEPKIVEFFLDYMSPTSYLAHTQLPAIAARTGAKIVQRPMLTLGVQKITGNRSPMSVPNKAKWAMADLKRFATRYGVPLNMNPHFPMRMRDALHGAMVALELGVIEAYSDALFKAAWVDGVDVDDRDALARCIEAAGIDPQTILSRIDDPAVKEALRANTAEAAERGAFGAPTFFVAGEMHFGQDRLEFVEEALLR